MIPTIDRNIGISVYSTKFEGIGGKIRIRQEDFVVSEILDNAVLSKISETGKYAVYKLRKHGMDTSHALSEIFQIRGLRLKALGLKDASAITEQFVCNTNTTKSPEKFTTNRYELQRIGFVEKPLTKKDMVGNRFEVKIHDVDIRKISDFEDYDKILNFFGYQRFGSKRPVSHLVGKAIIQNDFEQAVQLLLSFSSEYDSVENNKIRKMLEDRSNYTSVLKEIPPQMDLEKLILNEIVQHGDAIKAFHTIPLFLRRFFVRAFQSYIFNSVLSLAFDYGEEVFLPKEGDVCYDKKNNLGRYQNDPDQRLTMPLVGYSYSKKNRFDYQISKVLDSEQIQAKNFFLKEMQELSDEGGFRQTTIKCEQFSVNDSMVSFTLSRGSYATILLREIMKPSNPISAGF